MAIPQVSAEIGSTPDLTKVLKSAPASVNAVGVGHVFDNGMQALAPLDLHIDAGSFCTLLGPSGSGKTTLLRIFAGLLKPTSGRVEIGGRDVTDLPVQQRDIGFVFQHYALFPHMTVAQNIAYPLKIRGLDKDARAEKVKAILDLIDLGKLGDRRPDQLSGGQQQRVAIGRALVYDPRVLLLDEPLGALDRKLRQQLGADLRHIQQEAGTTAVYVTHDQEEAFLLSDSVVVMDHGEVRQQGLPEVIYERPRDLFVASFLGDTNVLKGSVHHAETSSAALTVGGRDISCLPGAVLKPGDAAACSVRPEDVKLFPLAPSTHELELFIFGVGTVRDRIFMGSRFRLTVDGEENTFVVEANRGEYAPEEGTPVQIGWRPGAPALVSIPEKAAQKA